MTLTLTLALTLTDSFQERFVITKGYSATTLPRFILSMRAAGRRCDLVLIDGDHGFVGTSNDLKVLREASGPHTAVVVDDVVPQCGEGLGGADEADAAAYCKTYLAYKAGEKRQGRRDLRVHRPGAAVRKVASKGVIEVAERYGPYAMGTRENPCFRTRQGPRCGRPHEFDWGFVVARYLNTD